MGKNGNIFVETVNNSLPCSSGADSPPAEHYLNRELSWLEFNERVLHQARIQATPLLERVRFLSIFTSNLDEFVMKRVGFLNRQLHAGIRRPSRDGLAVEQQLAAIRRKTGSLLLEQADIYRKEIVPALSENGIHVMKYEQLADEDRLRADRYFRERVFPVLTPLAVDPGHPFPFISNLSMSLGVVLRQPGRRGKLFARIKIPQVLPAFIRVDENGLDGPYHFIHLNDLVTRHVHDLFPGMSLLNSMPFRITRNADVERDEEAAEDLMDLISQELHQRKFEKVVRLEYAGKPDPWMLHFLCKEMGINQNDTYELPELLDYTGLKEIADLPIPKLHYAYWEPLTPRRLMGEDTEIFSAIRQGDLLVHHPYQSFSDSVERFVTVAANDPDVMAIKITLYRTGDDNPFIPALIRAAEAGKQVVAIVELKARFDERRNITLAQALEKAGVHVVYGVVGLKTHTKTTLVVRNEPDGLRCYVHIGTGNYHAHTARLYTDLSLLSCRPELAEDITSLFHFLTGRSQNWQYHKLLVAPVNMKTRFLEMIRREIENCQAGKPARIIAKMNTLEDPDVIQALYRASAANVPVDLIVRGFSCLKPGVPDLSQNIRVISVIGRFLEHSRIFHFAAGEHDPLAGEFYIGSADWMSRNLCSRVEVVTPIEDPAGKARLWQILHTMLNDRRQAWEMHPDGSYTLRSLPADADDSEAPGTHAALMDIARREMSQE